MAAKRPSDMRARLERAVASGGTKRPAPQPDTTADEPEVDTRPAMFRHGTKHQRTINWDADLLAYANEIIARLKRTHPEEPGVASLAALVDQAVREKITRWEKTFGDGKAFPPLA